MLDYMHALFPVNLLCMWRQFESCTRMVDSEYQYTERLFLKTASHKIQSKRENLKDLNFNNHIMCCWMYSLICIFLFELSSLPFYSEASDIMKSIGDAIHFLHSINIAHRDIKVIPHCIYLRQNLQWKKKHAKHAWTFLQGIMRSLLGNKSGE